MCHLMFDNLLFRLLRCTKDPLFYTYCQFFYALRFQKKKKKCIFGLFMLQFRQNSAPNTLILVKICSQVLKTLVFKKKIPSVDPTF